MAIGFELRVCRLIDIDPPPKPINWSNSSPYGVPRGGRISISTPCVRGCVCHQTARPCLKFRAIQPWNIDIPCHRSRIPQGRHQRTLFANGLHPYGCACTLQSSSEKKEKKTPPSILTHHHPRIVSITDRFRFYQFYHRRSLDLSWEEKG